MATPPVAGLHLQFGADASSEIVVSWHTLQPVRNPRVVLGRLDGKLEQTVAAKPTSYTDAKSGQVVYAYHARLGGLQPDTPYLYGGHARRRRAGVRHVPHRSARSRGVHLHQLRRSGHADARQEVPSPPAGVTLPKPLYVNDNLGSPAAGDTTLGVERLRPLFHLFNGDLCYANLAEDRVRTWWDFWENNSRSARKRPWMPSPGNHENELGNGPIGYQAYQTYFSVPRRRPDRCDARALVRLHRRLGARHQHRQRRRRVSGRRQLLCPRLFGGRAEGLAGKGIGGRPQRPRIDWIVVCMHQVAISTADKFNGADLGIREEWVPLFDKYGVDLVVCGHEHHYERSHPIRGQEKNADPDAASRRRPPPM